MKQVILALHDGGKELVDSYMVKNSRGLFAIHRPLDKPFQTCSWEITHVPSGKCMVRAIGDIKEARRIGAYIVALLNDMHDMRYVAWNAFESADPGSALPKPIMAALGNALKIGRDGRTFEADGRRALLGALVNHTMRVGVAA